MNRYDVAVVGGGPVGMWLAAELRRGGVRPVVLERRAARPPHSKALTGSSGGSPGLQAGEEAGALRSRVGCFLSSYLLCCFPIECSYDPVPSRAVPRTGGDPAAALFGRPVRLEPVRRAGVVVAAGPREDARLGRALPSADRGPRGQPVAGRGVG